MCRQDKAGDFDLVERVLELERIMKHSCGRPIISFSYIATVSSRWENRESTVNWESQRTILFSAERHLRRGCVSASVVHRVRYSDQSDRQQRGMPRVQAAHGEGESFKDQRSTLEGPIVCWNVFKRVVYFFTVYRDIIVDALMSDLMPILWNLALTCLIPVLINRTFFLTMSSSKELLNSLWLIFEHAVKTRFDWWWKCIVNHQFLNVL